MAKKLISWPDDVEEKFKILAFKKKIPVNTLVVGVLKDYLTRLENSRKFPEGFEESSPVVNSRPSTPDESF